MHACMHACTEDPLYTKGVIERSEIYGMTESLLNELAQLEAALLASELATEGDVLL